MALKLDFGLTFALSSGQNRGLEKKDNPGMCARLQPASRLFLACQQQSPAVFIVFSSFGRFHTT